ncbi:PAS domain S-box protein [Paenibacillus tengchongensis]|uniref:SpoIIE family protein phosphatase n=1 Tax=Paenibacillus tengchongensis TaxID=2608684 RepID=UPI00124C6AD1|nr:PAS domain S-box protein [Paenibacillus tengchongensis]
MATDISCKNLHHQPTPAQCRDHYGCIYDNNHLITLMIDPQDGGIVDANKAACEFYGYNLRMFRKLDLSDLSLDGPEGLQHFLSDVFPGGQYTAGRVITGRHKLSGGQIIDVEMHTGMITMLGKNCVYTVVHDVSERVRSQQRLKESEERYRDLVELCPEAILVYSAGTILFANRQAGRMFGRPKEELIGRSIDDFFTEVPLCRSEYIKLKSKNSMKGDFRLEQRYIRHDRTAFDLEISGAPITFEGNAALQLVFRDITESRKEMERAIIMQEHRHAAPFPMEHRAELSRLYIPAKSLSGDFYLFHKLDEQRVVGIIGDVAGKGISAALSISALRVLFLDSLQNTADPVHILQDLNLKAVQHLGEDYIAACCFVLDFGSGLLTAAGAGINEFIYAPAGADSRTVTVKGAPLGMFAGSEFEQTVVSFSPGDRFCFYSDGMELLFGGHELAGSLSCLQERMAGATLQDDCTWLSLTIK